MWVRILDFQKEFFALKNLCLKARIIKHVVISCKAQLELQIVWYKICPIVETFANY